MYARVNTESDEVESQIGEAAPDGFGPNPPPPDAEPGIAYCLLVEPIDWKAAPSRTSVLLWNGGSPIWHEKATIEKARLISWDRVKESRDAAEAADFEFSGVLYQPDVTKITGAVLEAMLPRAADEPPFSIDWTVSDNSVVTLNAAQMVGLGRTLAARLNAIHQKGRELRALIDNAETPAEAYGYTWDSI